MEDKSDEQIINDSVAELVRAGHVILESIRPVLDTLEGYQAECLSRGYTQDEARAMAVDLHHMMMRSMGNTGNSNG